MSRKKGRWSRRAEEIYYIDRVSKKEKKEKVYGGFFLRLLYGQGLLARLVSHLLLPLVATKPLSSHLYAALQRSSWSRCKIQPFIKKFHIDAREFAEPPASFRSFDDFFVRKLKHSARPLSPGNDVAIMPADGRFLVYPNIRDAEGFWVKGKKFSLEVLLGDRLLAARYAEGSLLIGRLAPVDYHRFHFPCNCIPEEARAIPGPLYSVNPLALKSNIHILAENKRMITSLVTKHFGTILYIEVGATHVGAIHQTFVPGEFYAKGDEKGYFSFGGSSLLLLFEPSRIQFDQDLLSASLRQIEVRALLGQSLGRALHI